MPYELPSDLEAAIVAFVSYYTGAITRPWATSHPRMSSEAGGRRSYDAGRKCRPKQSKGGGDTTWPSGSSPHLKTAPDLSALKVSHFCWLPTAIENPTTSSRLDSSEETLRYSWAVGLDSASKGEI